MKKMVIFIGLYFFVVVSSAFAAWQGPVTVLEGGWGSATGQFGIRNGDTTDEFPSMLAVSPSGRILVGDGFNIRIQLFSADGTFNGTITPKGFPTTYNAATYWPLSLFICGDQYIYTERNEYIQIYDFGGGLTQNYNNLDGGLIFIDQQCNFYTYNPSAKSYNLYSPTGQLIKTSATRPLELGVVKSQKLGENNYKITVTYPDKVYGLSADRKFTRYVRDTRGFIYGVNAGGAWRFNQCGKLTGTVLMPSSQIQETPRPGGGENIITVQAEYGQPVVAPNGDVYTWKRAGNYSILKWTWVDDPNAPSGPDAPTGQTVAASINGRYLTWTASPNDPGCVTGYEISRATTSGGLYSTLATLNAGVVKYNDSTAAVGTMYYYKVRAVAGSEYSPYTGEMSGKR